MAKNITMESKIGKEALAVITAANPGVDIVKAKTFTGIKLTGQEKAVKAFDEAVGQAFDNLADALQLAPLDNAEFVADSIRALKADLIENHFNVMTNQRAYWLAKKSGLVIPQSATPENVSVAGEDVDL